MREIVGTWSDNKNPDVFVGDSRKFMLAKISHYTVALNIYNC